MISRLQARIAVDYDRYCAASLPPVGLPTGTVAATVGTVPREQSLALLADLFGPSLTSAAVDCATDAAACKCQFVISRSYEKLLVSEFKVLLHCKKVWLRNPLATSSAAIENCVDSVTFGESIESANNGQLRLRIAKVADFISRTCSGVDTAVTLPGACAAYSGAALADCINERVRCRICLTVNRIDNIAIDCDQFDNHLVDLSCSAD